MKKKPQPKTLVVTDTETITPNMQRLTLQGEALSHFPRDCEGSYIKLLFNDMGGPDLSILSEDDRPIMRTYTIRRFHPETSSIEVDFVRHVTQDLQCGFAARWAMAAQKGDTINIVGPGSISNLNTEADWFFMAADMTALPALSAKNSYVARRGQRLCSDQRDVSSRHPTPTRASRHGVDLVNRRASLG